MSCRVLACLLSLTVFGTALRAEGRRMALVIGNSAYRTSKLPNAVPDATAVAKALQKAGFTLVAERPSKPMQDLTYTGMRSAFSDLKEQKDVDLLVIYYAGHAAQHDGVQYLVPVDARFREAADIKDVGISLDSWVDQIIRHKFNHTVIIVDGCRSSFPGEMVEGARVSGGDKVFVILSTSEGKTASDGEDGHHSPFATAFLKALEGPSQSVIDLFHGIQAEVKTVTQGKQEPKLWGDSATWQNVSLHLATASSLTPARPTVTAKSSPALAPAETTERDAFDWTQEQVLWSGLRGARMGVLKPAAVAANALRWPAETSGTLPKGWRRIQLEGWLVARGKEGREHMIADKDGWWHVPPQGKGGISDSNTLNLHAKASLDKDNTVAELSEGASVFVTEAVEIDGREWLHCTWDGFIKDEKAIPTVSFFATLSFPHPKGGETVSFRQFFFRDIDSPIEMSFTNQRRSPDVPNKQGRTLLIGSWAGNVYTSRSQKMLDSYKGWIDETIVLEFEPDFSGGTVTSEFPRKVDGRLTTAAARASLQRHEPKP